MNNYKRFSRRLFFLLILQSIGFVFVFSRLFQLQILERKKYKNLSLGNQTDLRIIIPSRGIIFDRNDKPIASSRNRWQILYTKSANEDELDETLDDISKLIDLTDDDYDRITKIAEKTSRGQAILIKNDLEDNEIMRIETYLLDLKSISIEAVETRYYEYKEATPIPIGYVGLTSTKDNDSYKSSILVGKSGIEYVFDSKLIGKLGYIRTTHDSPNEETQVIDELKATAGENIKTTINFDLQQEVYNYMLQEGNIGSCVVIDIETGEIICMVSAPTIDPNLYIRGIKQKEWDDLLNNPYTPLTNKPASGLYSPGSTIKPFLALAALDNDIVLPTRKILCNGVFELGNQKFHCWKRDGHGLMDLNHAIAESCDVYFYTIAQDLGMNNMVYSASTFGMGRKYFPDILSGEQAGILPTPSWKFALRGSSWQDGETIISAIGQGYWLVTPLQLAISAARIASGNKVEPKLIFDGNTNVNFDKLKFSDEHFNIVRQAMFDAVNSRYGTAKEVGYGLNGNFTVSGKTGTVQVKSITEEERLNGIRRTDQLPWELRDHSLFIGYFPKIPKYAISVVIDHGGSGANVASKIARFAFTSLKKSVYNA